MPNDMVCHVPEGELRVKQTDGMEFVAKKGDVWTCKKGIGEVLGKCRFDHRYHADHRFDSGLTEYTRRVMTLY
jgi:uncharacterized cupin superfamily protein